MSNSISTTTLFTQRRFTPWYLLHVLGCLYGDLYKNAFIILITYQAHTFSNISAKVIVALGAGLYILPMLLFSLCFGQMAERYSKTQIIQFCTVSELIVGLMVYPALYYQNLPLLLLTLFLFGTVSALFNPAKLGIMPQLFSSNELLKVNGLMQTGLFTATLVGTLGGGLLVLQPDGPAWVFMIVYALIIFTVFCCVFVIKVRPAHPQITIRYNPLESIKELLSIAKKNRLIVSAILGISWFWFFSIVFFMEVAPFTKAITHGSYVVATVMMMLLAISVAMGSLLCARFKAHRIELALVVYGAIGMTVFSLLIVSFSKFIAPQPLMGLALWLRSPLNWLVALSFCGMAMSAGFYLVPLSTLIHQMSDDKTCARLFSLNNISMALFVTLSSIFTAVLLKIGLSISHLFLLLAILNIIYTTQLFRYEPRFIKQFTRGWRHRMRRNSI